LTWFREQGYLPEALINFLALLGYGQPGEEEIFDFAAFSASFEWTRVNTVGPVFDLKKLDWLNGHYIRALSTDDLADRLLEFAGRTRTVGAEGAALLRAGTPLVQERMETLVQGVDMLAFLIVDDADFTVDEAAAAKQLGEAAAPVLEASVSALDSVADWSHETIEAALRGALIDGLGLKPRDAFGPVRVAVTGSTVSPPLFESLELLGHARALGRLRAAQDLST
jgi:glutamyl-tRNA synthetase